MTPHATGGPPSADVPDQADVVVVGSGGAALTAAYTAARGGLRTVVLEKTAYLGGTSAYSGAGIWLPGNQAQARGGLDDSVELGRAYFRAVVGDRTPEALQEAFLATGPELVAFLERDPALRFHYSPFPDYFDAPGRQEQGRAVHPDPLPAIRLGGRLAQLRPPIGVDQYGVDQDRETLAGGQALIGRLLLALDGTGNAAVFTTRRMRRLVVEEGRVVGVEVEGADGASRVVRLGRGVVLAAGGFECADALRVTHHGLPSGAWTSAAPGSNTGDALAAAVAAGASTDLMDEAWWCPATLFPNGRAAFTLGLSGGIFVDAAGMRFANESLPYDRMGHEILRGQAAGTLRLPFWFVFDDRFDSIPAIMQPTPERAAFEAAGLWRSAGSVAALAGRIGVPPDALVTTVDRFNVHAEQGKDLDFHRGEDPYDRFFGTGDGPNPCLVPIDRPPLHAVQVVLGDLGTKGGARIDGDGRVLDTRGDPIAGLYAAGNSAASVAGTVYPGPGTPLGSGMVFGYRAARDMLAGGGS